MPVRDSSGQFCEYRGLFQPLLHKNYPPPTGKDKGIATTRTRANKQLPCVLPLKYNCVIANIYSELHPWHYYSMWMYQRKDHNLLAALVNEGFTKSPPESVWGFLHGNFNELSAQYGKIYGNKIPAPKLYRVD